MRLIHGNVHFIILFYAIAILIMFSACGDDERKEASKSDGDEDGQSETELEEDDDAWQAAMPADCIRDKECTQVMVTAHRGYHTYLPENSLAAIRATAEVGAEFAEVDVRHTADEVLVLMHDGDVLRTTDGIGDVSDLSWEEIQALTLKRSDPAEPESLKAPLFSEALQMARELGIMLYIDQKTDRWDLVLAEIQSGEYYDEALVRDGFGNVQQMVEQDSRLLIMPPLSTVYEFEAMLEALPGLLIVEVSMVAANPELCASIIEAGVKVQQDVMAGGDTLGAIGDYSGWKNYIDAGVFLPQTDRPNLLVPAVLEYNRTGVFPDEGPGEGF